ncbi:hypothetical protein D6783_01995 [Candidatus Woesearchaeota archaeon]|nr:MAG: hypothetical protein D6783_01995 [Candidatus Woesearchaeota archaeon]
MGTRAGRCNIPLHRHFLFHPFQGLNGLFFTSNTNAKKRFRFFETLSSFYDESDRGKVRVRFTDCRKKAAKFYKALCL